MDWLINLLGTDLYSQFVISSCGLLEVFLCAFLFNFKTPKNKYYLLYYLFGIIILPFYALLLAYLRVVNTEPLSRAIIYSFLQLLYAVFFIFFPYKRTIYEKCLDFCALSAAFLMTGKIYSLMLNFAGVNDLVSMSFFGEGHIALDWTLYAAAHILMYFLFGFLFRERNKIIENRRTRILIISLFSFTVLACYILFAISRIYESKSIEMAIITKIFACLCCIFILAIRSGLLTQSKKEQEFLVLNELFNQETEQFKQIQGNIDIINAKCHDLRHQLNALEGRLTTDEIEDLKKATRFYDSTIKTGYEILDAILYEKMLFCTKENIQFTAIADGNSVRFMDSTHLYSLLSNGINNAIEACRPLDEEERVISLTIKEQAGIVIVEICNPCREVIDFKNGIPQTSKGDKTHHGYGFKSMKYIAKEYDGNVIAKKIHNMFSLKIYLSNTKSETEESDLSAENLLN